MKKKVLVCSVPCWNNKVGSDTLSSLLSGYDKDKLANLYIREELPDSLVCDKYFRISENAVIKSVFKRNLKTGAVVERRITSESKDESENAVATAKRYQKYGAKRNVLLLFAREILWFLGKWKTKELDRFLEDFKPDVVFFAMEGYMHFNRINRYILRKTGAKGIGYFWDDHFSKSLSSNIFKKLFRIMMRRSIRKTAKMCDEFFAITPKTKKEADETFGINCKVLTKPIDFSGKEFIPTPLKKPIKMVYTGKLIIGRGDTLCLLGKVLDEINEKEKKIELDIYTTTTINVPESFGNSVNFKGAVPQNEIAAIQQDADILVFVEALCGKNAQSARLSFSTKLTDYFGSGKCILAIGMPNIAPMEYLKENDAALCAYDYDSIKDAVKSLSDRPEMICEYAKKAYETGLENHNKVCIQKTLFDVFNNSK